MTELSEDLRRSVSGFKLDSTNDDYFRGEEVSAVEDDSEESFENMFDDIEESEESTSNELDESLESLSEETSELEDASNDLQESSDELEDFLKEAGESLEELDEDIFWKKRQKRKTNCGPLVET